MRVAEAVGDITDQVLEKFYSRYPEALHSFEEHCVGDRRELEGRMVEHSIYFLMTWYENLNEIKIYLDEYIPHHHDTLRIKASWFQGFLETVIDFVCEYIPDAETQELEAWQLMRTQAVDIVSSTRSYFNRPDMDLTRVEESSH